MKYPLETTVTSSDDHGTAGVASSPNFPQLEKDVLKYWQDNKIFTESVENNKAGENGSNEYVFYDGPPFANGLPHYGHLLTGYVKDVVPRFQTMMGKRVERRFGWDTHGLPAELEAQRELGIEDVNEIKVLGIEKFNEACRKSVLKYTHEWEDYVNRQARWVDFENDYKTLDLPFMESVLWAFKQLYEKGLAYKGYKVLPYCWNDQTPLSNHELRMDDDVYQERQDNTVTVAMRVHEESLRSLLPGISADEAVYLSVWTTTPWTLPTNFAVAVNPELEYVVLKAGEGAAEHLQGKSFILGKGSVKNYAAELGFTGDAASEEIDANTLATLTGAELAGAKYYPIFDYFKPEEGGGINDTDVDLTNAFVVATADYVGEGEGTGLVHLAPYGEDDMLVLGALGVKPPVPMTEGAILTAELRDYEDLHVFDANRPIVADLRNGTGSQARIPEKQRAVLVKTQSVAHSYPHCWRCRKPLIYRPISSWFVSVTKIKERLLALNEKINWIPDNVKHGQFGKWLEGARDWSISRNRFWGSPIPVWVSDNPKYPRVEVYGSLAEIEEAFAECLQNDDEAKNAYPDGKVNDLHRPKIDTLWRKNPEDPSGVSKMVRITDVFDCWFESGSMPFAQVHYPFENKQWFEDHFPADFIVEYIGQTRGWFYTLHIMATALFDCNAFSNVMCHGIVLGSDGQKMSESLRNYPDVNGVFDEYGSDAMRWFLMSSSILRGGNLAVQENAIRDQVRQVLLPLWNTYYFFNLYANSANGGEGYSARHVERREVDSFDVQDQYILAKTRALTLDVENALQTFDIAGATDKVRDFIDVLTNWYVRTNRGRFWNEDENAFNTLYTVLEVLSRVVAPLLPLTAEEIWRGLTGKKSVHLQVFPTPSIDRNADSMLVANDELVASIDGVREIISTVLSLRKASDMRVRQPLAGVKVALQNPQSLEQFIPVMKLELNVKNIELLDAAKVSQAEYGIEQRLDVNARALGPRIGKQVQDVIRSAKAGEWHLLGDTPVVALGSGEITLEPGEFELSVTTGSCENAGEANHAAAVLGSSGFVVLDLTLTQSLINEGLVRDIIREVQDYRKQQGFEVADRISLTLSLPQVRFDAATEFATLLKDEVLATSLELTLSTKNDTTIFASRI
jgi:isoleucyl-tRNA synthetase